jgi:hypothetical protein
MSEIGCFNFANICEILMNTYVLIDNSLKWLDFKKEEKWKGYSLYKHKVNEGGGGHVRCRGAII